MADNERLCSGDRQNFKNDGMQMWTEELASRIALPLLCWVS